jgi:hypothetical protein
MLYKFKSKAGSDVIMTGPGGDEVLGLLGKSAAPKGILEAADMPAAIQALESAVAAEDAAREQAEAEAAAEGRSLPPRGDASVSLRQRAWPLLELMKRAHPKGHDIVWGV